MSTADEALGDCHDLVKGHIVHLPVDDGVLRTFVEKFRRDFENTLASDPDAWGRDRQKVTSLARAIATFAEFSALTDPEMPRRVNYAHLKTAYEILGPFCRPGGVGIRRQYCTTAQP